MVKFLGVVKLGTFYKNGEELPLPTKPWRSGGHPYKLPKKGTGNTPIFTDMKDMNKWVIGDTSEKEENKLKWIKIKDGNKIIYICDRNILNRLSWNDLNNAGYVNGKEIVIDGNKYLCRLINGGSDRRNDDAYAGGFPTNNEWDRFIANEDNILGLPKPQDYDLKRIDNTYKSFDSEHNHLWNWWGNGSWYNVDKRDGDNQICFFRGRYSAKFCSYVTFDKRYDSANDNFGWRPVLELNVLDKFLIKQKNNYYSINNNYLNLGNINNNEELNDLINTYGYNDLSILTNELNSKRIPVVLKDGYYTSLDVNLNDLGSNINITEEYNKKFIQYDCGKYKIIDKIKENNNGRFEVLMKTILY
ncbi:hypothetical protein [Clostridium rectalis]|uniref:hypothetical protein n=1 Tax=Clostridium rectalis TaxID=2040295 RepID=UPI000F62D301|nr:hypothetical protein [Clostridium rectalis]